MSSLRKAFNLGCATFMMHLLKSAGSSPGMIEGQEMKAV
jgi:hypothetical protein